MEKQIAANVQQNGVVLLAAMEKLEAKAKGKRKHKAPVPAVVERQAKLNGASKGRDKVPAGINFTAYGTDLAKQYDAGIAAAGGTWQEGIVFLLKTANDKQREQAMSAVIVYAKAIAKEKGSDFRVSALKKRVSEARRIFKAATIKGHAEVVKTMEAPGSWHQKVAKMPKATNKGAKKGAKTPVAKPETAAEILGISKGHEKVHDVNVNDVIALTKRLSTGKMLLVLDVIAFELSKSADIYEQGCGKQIMQFRDRQEAAVLKKAVG